MTIPATLFDQVDSTLNAGGAEAVTKLLDLLEGHLRRSKEYFQLFEVLKFRVRQQLGLPLMPGPRPEDLPERTQRRLDEGLIDACQTIGTLLFRDGNFQHGWSYLQPTGNRRLIEALIREVPVNDETINALIDIAFNQGGAPGYGYELMIRHHGTCNAITAFEVQANQFDRPTQATMAASLLHHVYDEVIASVGRHIEQQNAEDDPSNRKEPHTHASLRELLAEHAWLVEQEACHLDATHLASLMKIARVTETAEDHELALQLAEYGIGFPVDSQYPSPAPFENTYLDHQIFFGALLGHDVDGAVAHFQAKSKSAAATDGRASHASSNSLIDEVIIDFLHRLGKVDDAIAYATSRQTDPTARTGLAPDLAQMPASAAQFGPVLTHLRQQGDLLGYAAAAIRQHETLGSRGS